MGLVDEVLGENSIQPIKEKQEYERLESHKESEENILLGEQVYNIHLGISIKAAESS